MAFLVTDNELAGDALTSISTVRGTILCPSAKPASYRTPSSRTDLSTIDILEYLKLAGESTLTFSQLFTRESNMDIIVAPLEALFLNSGADGSVPTATTTELREEPKVSSAAISDLPAEICNDIYERVLTGRPDSSGQPWTQRRLPLGLRSSMPSLPNQSATICEQTVSQRNAQSGVNTEYY